MKKIRVNKSRILAALMSLCMIISLFNGIDLSSLFQNETTAQAEDGGVADSSEYQNETLKYRWDNDSAYRSASRPLYASVIGAKFGGLEKRTIFHVFAFEGETICVGSSVADSQYDIDNNIKTTPEKGSVDIVMTDINGVKHPIDIRYDTENNDLTGFIENPYVERAALDLKKVDGKIVGKYTTGGKEYTYTPYTYTVTETGVYTFEFHSYNGTGNTAVAIPRVITSGTNTMPSTANGHKYGTNSIKGWIAALNLSVMDESGNVQTGRTYADYLSMEMGPTGGGVKDSYYILTTDSYIYKMQFNGASPYTYNFFSNNRGITDTSGKIIYKSVKDTFNTNNFDKFKIKFKYPGTKDTETDKSFYIFLEYPDDDLYGHLYEKALLPDPATDIKFVDEVEIPDGSIGVKKVPGAYEGMGGYFSFKVGEATTATLRLEFKNIKAKADSGATALESYAPVEISGPVTPNSPNAFYWDGCDGNGVPIPPGTYSIEDIVFTVTAKAGEIHFPIQDMEFATGGITFTRMSHIYDKAGVQLDTDGSIYDLTKSVIYYDDTAIYYGEKVTTVEGSTSENQVGGPSNATYTEAGVTKYYPTPIKDFFAGLAEGEDKRYWTYNNMLSGTGGEYESRKDNSYVGTSPTDDSKIRVGDHSHTTNIIQYFDEVSGDVLTDKDQAVIDELDMIRYLNSKANPVGKASGTTMNAPANGNSTTDYAIANFWTFIPAKPETSKGTSETITIVAKDDDVFNLRGRVFYDDSKRDGKFDQSSTTGEYLMPGVKVNLYKKTEDNSFDDSKTYVNEKGELFTASNFDHTKAYELVATGETTLEGNYVFKGLKYNADTGTEYLYQVVKPNTSYEITSSGKTANDTDSNGYYKNYTYNQTYRGTEIQKILVGGSGVDPTKKYNSTVANSNPNCTVSAVDVGYYYETLDHMVTLKKSWKLPTETTEHPESVVFELSYTPKGDTTTFVEKYFTLSGINSWKADNQYLAKIVDGNEVDNYFVSAEYYISGDDIYKHTFDYDGSTGKYRSFVGKTYKIPLSELKSKLGSATDIKAVSDIDLSMLATLSWGAEISVEEEPYKAVLDRETNTDTTITITNSDKKGSIEIFKYYDIIAEKNALQGATFRVYQLDESKGINAEKIKELADQSDGGDATATAELRSYQVGSGTTRANGRLAFPGLDPSKSYVIREMFPPAGYRILREFYEVHPVDSSVVEDTANGIYKFNADNYVQLNIGNAAADGNFYIIKQIEGRSWQGADAAAGIDADSFSFTVLNDFEKVTDLTEAKGIEISTEEKALYSSDTEIINKLSNFVSEFKLHNNINVDYGRPYYSYTAVDTHGYTHNFTFPDRKNSLPLLVDGSEKSTVASFCSVNFEVAGVYTFTITEDAISSNSTLTKSPLEYTVKINVKRELTDEATSTDPSQAITLANSHLVAEVSSITYKDSSDSSSTPQIFAGNSPLFTNVYAPAPAKQSTTYNIEKSFTGRKEDEWLKDDNFTVRVSGDDVATQEAIANKNLIINGLKNPNAENVWVHTFTVDNNSAWEFDSFTFDDIIFPVQYVKKDNGEVWDPDKNDGAISPPNIGDYEVQTIPVEYWLKISEDIPDGNHKGITYDSTVYYLHIILRNAEADHDTESEEEDGIIDEMDLNLYKCDKDQSREMGDLVATCKTVQRVVTAADWHPEDISDGVTWWYLTESGELLQYKGALGTPTNYKKLIKKTETHTNEVADGHTMKIENRYDASYVWTPQVQKELVGRTWREGDKFTFTLTPSTSVPSEGHNMTEAQSVDIVYSLDPASTYTEAFAPITFTKPGTYTFTLTENTPVAGGITQPKPIIITVTATDNNDGTLKLEFNVTDEDGNPLAAFDDYNGNTPLTLTNTYNDMPKTFAFEIKKTLIGRNWAADDEFTFTITPDDVTKTAIGEGLITMPIELTPPKTGSDDYTAEIINADGGGSATNVITKALGDIMVNGLPADEDTATYTFTIAEDTTGLAEKNMLCRHEKVILTVEVARKLDENNIPTGELNVSASYKYSDGTEISELFNTSTASPSATPLTATIPFENICLGTLTVGKEVVSSNEDTTPFSFTVEFKFDKDSTNKFTTDEIDKITAALGSVSVKPTVSTDGLTYTYKFNLKHGESITFSNILPYTSYNITEGTEPDNYMFLRIMDKNGNGYKESVKQQVTVETISIEDPPDKYTFISGKIHNLPSAGGTGTQLILLGGLVLIIAAGLFYTLFHKNDKCREAR